MQNSNTAQFNCADIFVTYIKLSLFGNFLSCLVLVCRPKVVSLVGELGTHPLFLVNLKSRE